MQENNEKKEKIIVYIDGFNLYFGLKDANLEKFKWLNINILVSKLIRPNQEIVAIKYFTSRVTNNPEKQKRQSTYIDALESTGIKVVYGKYQNNNIECIRCGNNWSNPKEKMTDVNIATDIIVDAFNNIYDMAMLISGDSDLIPPIKAVHSLFKNKRVFIAFPPKRSNQSLINEAKGHLVIGRNKIINSQFEDQVISKSNFILKKPIEWK